MACELHSFSDESPTICDHVTFRWVYLQPRCHFPTNGCRYETLSQLSSQILFILDLNRRSLQNFNCGLIGENM